MSLEYKIGDQIEGRYDIYAAKRGGMGIVYFCYDHIDNLPVVVKTFQEKYLRWAKR